jgi:hypothetical protein
MNDGAALFAQGFIDWWRGGSVRAFYCHSLCNLSLFQRVSSFCLSHMISQFAVCMTISCVALFAIPFASSLSNMFQFLFNPRGFKK